MEEIIELKIPNLGEAEETEVIELSVSEGDCVNENDPLIVLESEKAAMEVPSDYKGEVKKLLISEGENVKEGMVFALLKIKDQKGKQNEDREIDSKPTNVSAAKEENIESRIPSFTNTGINAGPAVRKYARELEINLSKIIGTGRNGKITKEDLKKFIHSLGTMNNAPRTFTESDFKTIGDYEIINQTKIGALSAKNLHDSWTSIPHVTHFESIELSSINRFRNSENVSLPAIFVKVCAEMLREAPKFNSSLIDGNRLLIKKDINIGIAVDTNEGLVVPVIHNADKKTFQEISEEIKVLAEKAKTKKLLTKNLQNATFSISSLGKIGGIGFTPIINPPEVAIIGLSRSYKSLSLSNKGDIQENEIMPISLSYDHRVINGADAGRFMLGLRNSLESIK